MIPKYIPVYYDSQLSGNTHDLKKYVSCEKLVCFTIETSQFAINSNTCVSRDFVLETPKKVKVQLKFYFLGRLRHEIT